MVLPKRSKVSLPFSSSIDVRFVIRLPKNMDMMAQKLTVGAQKAIVKDVGDEIFNESQRNIMTMGIVNEGWLYRSGYRIWDGPDMIVGYAAPHAAYINDGTGPAVGHQQFCPPLEPLIEWARKNVSISGRGPAKTYAIRKKGGHMAKQGPTQEMLQITRIAQGIQHKIFLHGQKPRPFFDDAISTVRARLPAITSASFHGYLKKQGVQKFDDLFKKTGKKFIKEWKGGKTVKRGN